MTDLAPTPGQTVGPFFGTALPYAGGELLVPPGHREAVTLTGRVLDGAGRPVPDALIELWQRAPDGSVVAAAGSLRRDGWTFTGWGRAATDAAGRYRFTTLTPGAAEGAAAFFALTVFARGLLDRLFTRAYLPGGDELDADPLFAGLTAEDRGTLLAAPIASGWTFDIRLQGERETTFLTHGARAR